MSTGKIILALECDDPVYNDMIGILEKSYEIKRFFDPEDFQSCLGESPITSDIAALILPKSFPTTESIYKMDFLVYFVEQTSDLDFVRAGIATLSNFGDVSAFPELVAFQSENKYLLMMYSQVDQKILGSLVSQNREGKDDVLEEYRTTLIRCLSGIPTLGQVNNTLLHMFGYFKNELDSQQKRDFLEILDSYHAGKVVLKEPVGILHELSIVYGSDYLANQTLFRYFK